MSGPRDPAGRRDPADRDAADRDAADRDAADRDAADRDAADRDAADRDAADPRTARIAAALAAVRARIAAGCAAAGSDQAGVTLIAVTKTFPVDDARRLLALGVLDLGENRDQDAAAKAALLGTGPAAGAGGPVAPAQRVPTVPAAPRWHFLGRLQRNKCRSVAGYATAVHSLDRPVLVAALAAGAVRAGRELDVLVQVSLDGDPDRGGVSAAGVPALADAVAAADGLRLAGVMAVAPVGADPDRAFARLAAVAAAVRADHPAAGWVSAGMSGDLEAALRHGATHVRVGTALLGGRPGSVG